MALEEHPEGFYERFRDCAVRLTVLPAPDGHPLLELAGPEGLLYAFDRGAPPVPPGEQDVLLHGVARAFEPYRGPAYLRPLAGGGYRAAGQVQKDLGSGFYCFDAGVRLLIHAAADWRVGDELEVELAPPLMGFRP